VLHTGDQFLNGGAPFIDYSAKASIIECDKTIERMLQLDFDTVIPGHGAVAKKADLVKWRQTLAQLRSKAKVACAGGATDALKRMNLEEIGMKPSPLFERSVPGMCQELQ
jgi:glyoxylase-like metal-dependent hydrolase (beta-lactamase superfamily II)